MAMLQSAMDMMNMYGATPAPTKLVGYYPGDKIEVLVTLRPYREDSVERMVELTIPDDFTVGQTMIEVFGGTASYYGGMVTMDASMQGGGYTAPVMGSPETLDEAINLFESRSPNNSITVRLIQTTPQDPYFYLQDNYKPPKEISSVITTDEVVYGYFSLPIEILSKDQANTTVEGSAQEAPGGETTPVQEETGRSRSRNPHRH
jgi:hypothetical protein